MVIKKVVNGASCRLAWYFEKGAERSWDMEWQQFDRARLDDFVEFSRRDRMLIKVFQEYLPKDGRILEGGCGLGQWVLILQEMGYQIEGVDISELAIRKVRSFYPSLCLSVGNILSLNYPDSHFSAYISLGVVEHFEAGPDRALQEAHRILRNGAILLCSVPYFNLVRRVAARSPAPSTDLIFYQWAFSKREFGEILGANGFRVKDAIPYAVIKTVMDVFPIVGRFSVSRGNEQTRNLLVSRMGWKNGLKHVARNYPLNISALRRISGHMILFVAEAVK